MEPFMINSLKKIQNYTYGLITLYIACTQFVYAESQMPANNIIKEKSSEIIKPLTHPVVMQNTRAITAKVSIPLVEGKQRIPVMPSNSIANNAQKSKNEYTGGNFSVIENQKSNQVMPVKNRTFIDANNANKIKESIANTQEAIKKEESTSKVKIIGLKVIENGFMRTEYYQPKK